MKNYKKMAISLINKRKSRKNELKLLSVFFVSAKVINEKEAVDPAVIEGDEFNSGNFVKAFGGYLMSKNDRTESSNYVRKLNNFWMTL
jgi:hypothetical protein